MKRTLVLLVLPLALFLALPAHAAALEVSGWVPYWSGSKGTKDARKHLDALSVVMPFSFTVKSDGSLKDLAGMRSSSWKRLVSSARGANVLVLPTVMTSDGATLHTILSQDVTREAHIQEIVSMVNEGKYDGVDIDYEGKRASTKPYYSAFLKELKQALGNKILSCTIEARTPPEDLYRTVPATIEYANDFTEINRWCDRVTIMAYDQQRADLSLNDARKGTPYIPVADVAWVEKVMTLTAKTIDKNKLVLGVPTYGAEWELNVAPEWYMSYQKLWAFNPSYAEKTAKKEKVKAGRNAAGELSYTYLPRSSKKTVGRYEVPSGTKKGNEAAAQALAYASETGQSTVVHVVWWSDAEAIAQKVELAQKLGLRGVALFKIDGGEDADIWKLF